jgi:hypothetical protein
MHGYRVIYVKERFSVDQKADKAAFALKKEEVNW